MITGRNEKMKISKGTITLAIKVLTTIRHALYFEAREIWKKRKPYNDLDYYNLACQEEHYKDCYKLIDKTIIMLEEWKEKLDPERKWMGNIK